MLHSIVISALVIAISVYMGKTLAREKDKESRKLKLMIDITLIGILFLLAIGYGTYIYKVAQGGIL